VLELLVAGVTSNRELAARLFISENTVKYHLRQILEKLHLQNRAQVIAYAVRHGLVDPGQSDAV
jgi:DNA-binding CsgD family transcriptional regulator